MTSRILLRFAFFARASFAAAIDEGTSTRVHRFAAIVRSQATS
ncbi:MAG: hypothetical protein P4L33_11765 [Capsulimonadaceae bacterium]|nr:hypothetical protein [Capsulimonadaceae bacterium]